MLGQIKLFSSCSRKELERLAALTTPIEVAEGEVIVKEGQPGNELFVIQSGTATVTLEGRELATLYPGDEFGEMSLLDHEPRSATVTASTPMQLFVLGPQEFAAAIEDIPAIGRKILKILGQRLREVERAPVP